MAIFVPFSTFSTPHRVVCVRFRVAVRATEGGELARFIVGKAGAKGCPALRARLLRHSVIQVVPVRQGYVLVGLPHQVPDRIISVFRCQGAVAGPGPAAQGVVGIGGGRAVGLRHRKEAGHAVVGVFRPLPVGIDQAGLFRVLVVFVLYHISQGIFNADQQSPLIIAELRRSGLVLDLRQLAHGVEVVAYLRTVGGGLLQ